MCVSVCLWVCGCICVGLCVWKRACMHACIGGGRGVATITTQPRRGVAGFAKRRGVLVLPREGRCVEALVMHASVCHTTDATGGSGGGETLAGASMQWDGWMALQMQPACAAGACRCCHCCCCCASHWAPRSGIMHTCLLAYWHAMHAHRRLTCCSLVARCGATRMGSACCNPSLTLPYPSPPLPSPSPFRGVLTLTV